MTEFPNIIAFGIPELDQTEAFNIRSDAINKYLHITDFSNSRNVFQETLSRYGITPLLYHAKVNLELYYEKINIPLDMIKNPEPLKDAPQFTINLNHPNPLIKFTYIEKGVSIFPKLNQITGLTEFKQLSLALQLNKTHKIKCYKKDNTLLVITNQTSPHISRKLIASLPLIFPETFKDIPDEIINLLKLLGGEDYNEWLNALKKWFNKIDFVKPKFMQLINSKVNNQKRIIMSNIKNIDARLTNNLQALASQYKEKETYLYQLQALELAPEEDGTELYEYIKKHPGIVSNSLKIENSRLFFTTLTPLQYYDSDVLKAYYKSSNSLITTDNDIARLFDETFLKQKYKILVYTRFYLDFINNQVGTGPWASSLYPEVGIAQPHIMQHNCLGNNAPNIIQQLSSGNYMVAIEQCIAAAKNINFTDITVLRTFIDNIRANSNKNFIEDTETGEIITYKEFTKKLKEEETE